MTERTSDYEYQLAYVAQNAWRLLAMQDRNRLSPAYGCFHYAYWRDKTSEFPDSRFQEAGATLGILSLPAFNRLRADGVLPSAETLYESFSAALSCLSRQQYPEGCYDEWYRGERGFAAAAFTTIAYGLAARFLRNQLKQHDRELLAATIERSAEWLTKREDLIKLNHEAAGAAALALAWEVTGKDRYKAEARRKLDITLAHQTEEGWFPEVKGLDLGYCSVLLDQVMLYVLVTGDDTAIPAMRRLMAFLLPHLHPDLTILPEAGICLNPYVSRLGIGLLAPYDDAAAAVVARSEGLTNGVAGIEPYLADDLRFARWSWLPTATALLRERFRGGAEKSSRLLESYPTGWTHKRLACVSAYHDDHLHLFVAPSGGGTVKCYVGDRPAVVDEGVDITVDGRTFTSRSYDAGRPLVETKEGLRITISLAEARFFYPSFLLRLILRLGSTNPLTSRWLRAAIDFYRTRMRTAINQSAAPLSTKGNRFRLTRTVEVLGDTLLITDEVIARNSDLSAESLQTSLVVDGRRHSVATGEFSGKSTVRVEKRFRPAASGTEVSIQVSST